MVDSSNAFRRLSPLFNRRQILFDWHVVAVVNTRFLQYDIGLVDYLLADFGDTDFILGAALEQANVELFLQFLYRDT